METLSSKKGTDRREQATDIRLRDRDLFEDDGEGREFRREPRDQHIGPRDHRKSQVAEAAVDGLRVGLGHGGFDAAAARFFNRADRPGRRIDGGPGGVLGAAAGVVLLRFLGAAAGAGAARVGSDDELLDAREEEVHPRVQQPGGLQQVEGGQDERRQSPAHDSAEDNGFNL